MSGSVLLPLRARSHRSALRAFTVDSIMRLRRRVSRSGAAEAEAAAAARPPPPLLSSARIRHASLKRMGSVAAACDERQTCQ